jgi:predicted DNA-binding transcriptional regulator AlpA
MPRLIVHCAGAGPSTDPPVEASTVEAERRLASPAVKLPPLLVDIAALAELLARSVPSLHRDDAAGRLPAGLRIGGSKRWRYSDIVAWVELGCPPRAEFEARQAAANGRARRP